MRKKRWIKKTLKIIGILLLVLIVTISILFYRIFRPLSDLQIVEKFETETIQPFIKYINFGDKKVRVIQMQKEIDPVLPTLVFVHGSPGSSMDFKRYLSDEELNKKTNLITYDRIGYGENYRGDVLNSVNAVIFQLHLILS